jgi:hypothetical protein
MFYKMVEDEWNDEEWVLMDSDGRKKLMSFIQELLSNREKEIAEEVENLKEVCTECENREIHDTDRNKVLDEVLLIIKKDALSIIKHQ